MEFDLIFEGGGAKGIVFVGAVREFEARWRQADRLAGTSPGPSPRPCGRLATRFLKMAE